MFEALPENSIALIIASEWLPTILTILLGGWFASVLIPRLQANFERNKTREKRRFELAEEVAQNLVHYRMCWERLLSIAKLEQDRKEDGLTEVEFDRKKTFVKDRNEARDKLINSLTSVQFYFSKKSQYQAANFIEWDQSIQTLGLQDLPRKCEWELRITTLIKTLHEELAK
nr:hypothetical protein [uncultured Ruegeria sp.]